MEKAEKVKRKHLNKDKKSIKSSKKKEKKSKTKKSKKHARKSSSEESSDSNFDSKIETSASSMKDQDWKNYDLKGSDIRESWMTGAFDYKFFTKEPVSKKLVQPAYKPYDPATSSRELNPHWKSTGTGLPAFQKPSENENMCRKYGSNLISSAQNANKSWKKQAVDDTSKNVTNANSINFNNDCDNISLNELNAKILKADLMGNSELSKELKEKLEKVKQNQSAQHKSNKQEEHHILLTHTDKDGNCRPLRRERETVRDRKESNKRSKNMRSETHVNGERVRYFADDDKYDLKQMFEQEKYTSAADANLQFINMSKNVVQDAEDIHLSGMPKEGKTSERCEYNKAVQSEKRVEHCERCFDSAKYDKKLLVSYGSNFYLSLPWHVGLQPGHCLLTPLQHVSASTLLDENSWEELIAFRQALTNMFAAQGKEALFFEIAKNLQARKHMSIHCIPIPKNQSETAPFYFKKAIEESEQEWNVNKQLVSLRQKNLRNSIPKGLPYFWVHFGMDYGFAHVIEDERRFPNNFAEEIIGGLLELHHNRWRRPRTEDQISSKISIFNGFWKKYGIFQKN